MREVVLRIFKITPSKWTGLNSPTGAFTALTVNITGTTNAVSDNKINTLSAGCCNRSLQELVMIIFIQIVFIPLFQAEQRQQL
jgi:hypothetical protein